MKKTLPYLGIAVLVLVLLFGIRFFATPTISSEISKEDAIEKVEAREEVVQYVSHLTITGAGARFNAEDRGNEWAVQVFEIVQQGENSHTATFNWYLVDKKTGAVSREF